MSFPPAFLEELRVRLPLSDIIGKRIRLIRAGREFKACCPFHNEKSPSFYVNDDKQFFHCFGCGAHGDVIGFTMRHDRLSFPEAIESLAGQAGLQVPRDTPVDKEHFDKEKRLYQLLDLATTWFEEQLHTSAGREALTYLQKRGLSAEAMGRFRLGYAPNDGRAIISQLTGSGYKMDELAAVGLVRQSEERSDFYSFFRNRVMFPVGDRRGRTVAFGGRVLGDGEPKYLNSPDNELFHKGKLLYGLSRARTAVSQNQPLIVVEGYMDVIALVEAGYSGAVAPLGTALTVDQLSILWSLLPPPESREPARDYSPILCFDGDNAGIRAASRTAERVLPLLTATHTIRIATITGAKDPDELIKLSGKSAMDAVLEDAKPMIDVLWDTVLADRSLDTPEKLEAFSASIKHSANEITDANLRQRYKDEIWKRLQKVNKLLMEVKKALPEVKPQWKKGQSKTARQPDPILTRKKPSGQQLMRERVLLALIINHPALFNDFGEDLALIGFSSPEFEILRQRVIDILSLDTQVPLNAPELYRHLSNKNDVSSIQPCLTEILSENTYIHAGYARPEGSLNQAKQGWKSIWNNNLKEKLQIELQLATRKNVKENTDEGYIRIQALREQISALTQQEGEILAQQE